MNTTVVSSPRAVDIDDFVLAELNKRRGDWPRIAQRANVSYSWIAKFVNGRIPGAKVDTLKKLRSALALMDQEHGAESGPPSG